MEPGNFTESELWCRGPSAGFPARLDSSLVVAQVVAVPGAARVNHVQGGSATRHLLTRSSLAVGATQEINHRGWAWGPGR